MRLLRLRTGVFAFVLGGILILAGCATEEKLSDSNGGVDGGSVVKFDDSPKDSALQTQGQPYQKMYGMEMKFNKKAKPQDFFQKGESYSKVVFEIDEKDISWEGKNGSVLYAEPGRISYSTKDFSKIYDGLLSGSNGEFRDDFDTLCGGEELEGFSKEQAIQTIWEITDKYGINAKNAQAYPLRSDVLLKLSKEFMSDEEYEEYLKDDTNEAMKREFSKEDEAYLVLMDSGVGEYSLYSSSYDYGENSFGNSLIWAIVKREGLAAFEADGVYELQEKQTSINEILTQEEAQSALKEKYQDMILKDGLICRKVELTYLAVNGKEKGVYEFIPAYAFDVEYSLEDEKSDKQKKAYQISQTILLDAENGRWIE